MATAHDGGRFAGADAAVLWSCESVWAIRSGYVNATDFEGALEDRIAVYIQSAQNGGFIDEEK